MGPVVLRYVCLLLAGCIPFSTISYLWIRDVFPGFLLILPVSCVCFLASCKYSLFLAGFCLFLASVLLFLACFVWFLAGGVLFIAGFLRRFCCL